MMLDNPLRLIRELKGAPLSIVMCLQIVRMRVSQGWLEAQTGYTDKTICRGLDYLAEIGLVDHTSSGWQLTRGAVQLPLPAEQLPAETVSESDTISDTIITDGDINSDTDGGIRRNSDSLLVSLVNLEYDNQDSLTKLTNSEKSRKNSDSDPVWEELISVGVKRNRATEQIAALDWVDSAFVRGMIEKLEGEGRTWPKDCGLLLYRLKQRPKAMRHGKDCRCDTCDQARRRRYACGVG